MYNTYVVATEDTLDSIANKFGITKEAIEQFNGYNLELIPGLKLIIPSKNSDYFNYYVIKQGDTLFRIANKYKLNPSLLAQLNGLNESDYIYPNQVLLVPKAGTIVYFTMIGDTLSGVANGFNVDVMDVVRENKNIYLQPEQLIVYKHK